MNVERGQFINIMGEDTNSPDRLENPVGIGEAVKPSRDEGIATQALQIPVAETGGSGFNLDYALPYVVTEVSRDFSPFYSDDDSIGLEDKLIGREITQDKQHAAENVAHFFAERGSKILKSMERLHGEDYAARARALMRSGGDLAPETSPQGREDRQIIGHLEQALSAFVKELNTNIKPEANNFRQEIYRNLGTKDPRKILELYKRGLITVKPDTDLGYAKKGTPEVLEAMKPSERSAWGFVRNLVRTLSNPEFRTQSKSLSQLAI